MKKNNKIRTCESLEDFENLIFAAKEERMSIFFNDKKMDKRKKLIEDFDDIFDNHVSVQYVIVKGELHIYIGRHILIKEAGEKINKGDLVFIAKGPEINTRYYKLNEGKIEEIIPNKDFNNQYQDISIKLKLTADDILDISRIKGLLYIPKENLN